MKVQVEKVSNIVQKLSIEVEFAVVERELTAAYAELSKQVKVPGFRPGKVPRRMLETRFRTEVEADVVRRVQLKSALEAIQSQKVPAIGQPRLTGGKIVAGAPMNFVAEFDVKPEVQLKQWKQLSLKRQDTTVADTAVAEQVEKLRQSRANLVPATGRDVVQVGDWVSIDFDATHEGKPFMGGTGRGVTVEVSPGDLTEGNLPQLEGAKVGEPKTFHYTFPATFRNEEMAAKTAAFTATVKELKQKEVPALDDTFAKAVGSDSVDALKAKVRADLERAAKARVAVDERTDVFNALIAANDFEVPPTMVETGIDMLLDAAFGQMFRAGVDPRQLSLDWSKLREELRPKSVLESKGQLLLEAITKAEKVEVTDAELEARLVSLAEESGQNVAQLKAQFQNAKQRENLQSRVLEEKAIELVKKEAKYS
jgi:trigger factor